MCSALAENESSATVAELAIASGIGRSTAAKLLAALETAGLAAREPGGRDRGKRQPDRWTGAAALAKIPANTASESSAEVTIADHDGCSDSADAQSTDQGASWRELQPASSLGDGQIDAPDSKLGKGELREQVLAYLVARPDEALTPSAIAMALSRSAGAVANACERLVVLGSAVRTSPTPRRYRAIRVGEQPAS